MGRRFKSSGRSGILGRGSACLACRRRKMKCSGTRPACQECNDMDRVHECRYDVRKSRTQMLREKLSSLEAKLRELEGATPQEMSPLIFSDSSGGGENYIVSHAMHHRLVQTFIRHHRQICFYTSLSRFDSSSATIFPPSPPLMSAIYLLGSFFSQPPLPSQFESQLLNQAICILSQCIHDPLQHYENHLMDAVQASCLLAQYFYFNRRVLEGNRHLLTAKLMAFGSILKLHLVSDLTISTLFGPAYESALEQTAEKSAVFWQVYMVDKLWSPTCEGDITASDSAYRMMTTPLPVKEGVALGVSVETIPTCKIFDHLSHDVDGSRLSTVALKAVASKIFDRSLRIHHSWSRDEGAWDFQVYDEDAALKNLFSWVDPFPSRRSDNEPYFDTDLYAIHTLMLTSTIHLYSNNITPHFYYAVQTLIQFINFLLPEDYHYLDPILAICWYTIIVSFRRIAAPIYIGDLMAPCPIAFLTNNLIMALINMSRYVPLAGHLFQKLQEGLTTMGQESRYFDDLEHSHYPVVRF